MFSEEMAEIRRRIEKAGIGPRDTLSILDLILLPDRSTRPDGLSPSSPYEAFANLNGLINLTLQGVRIERFKPRDNHGPFHTLEIHTEEGEILGYLNMFYLKKAIPCYYLVYVEVMPPFRGLGLGNRILHEFMEFVKEKRAIGLLDNIIPPEEVTYGIYARAGWRNINDLIGRVSDGWENYMVFVPEVIPTRHLSSQLVKLLFTLSKKRPVIDMHDNEDMVHRTIEEFRSAYRTMEELFAAEILSGTSSPLMRFLFTRLATKLIGFRRRIAALIGYTGGESLEQISFSDRIKELPIQPYSLWDMEPGDQGEKKGVRIWGDKGILRNLPGSLKEDPTTLIERLPLYRRPYLQPWMEKKGTLSLRSLTIGDLLDFGFDPTRLRECHHAGTAFIFERIAPQFLPSLIKKKRFLCKIEKRLAGLRFQGASLQTNPPLLIFQDRGNTYVLRKKVEGIHSEEALDQLKVSARLREMDHAVGLSRLVGRTILDIRDCLKTVFKTRFKKETEDLTYFLSWDIARNIPRVDVNIAGVSLDRIWLA